MTATLYSTAGQAPLGGAFGHRLAPSGDPLEGAAFDAIYEQKIKPELVKAEAQRGGAVLIFIGAVIATLILLIIEVMLTRAMTGGQSSFPNIWVLLATIVVVPFVGYLPLATLGEKAKLSVIQALCGPIDVDYGLSSKEFPNFGTFQTMNLLPDNLSGSSFSDIFSGRRGQTQFTLCNARLDKGSGRDRRTVFSGQVFRLATPRRPLATTVVLRNSGWFNRFECPKGLASVGLEDPMFNKSFAVFGADQVEAREILTPVFMQELNDLEAVYSAAHLRCAFCGEELFIAMQGKDRFEIGNLFTSLVQRGRVETIARDIEQVFKLIDRFAG
jgi:hypothetical protein